jgi:hypothetical protein
MNVAELLKKLNRIPSDTDVYIADNTITTWPLQIPIDSLLYNEKNKTVYILAADLQTVPPEDIIEKMTYRDEEYEN